MGLLCGTAGMPSPRARCATARTLRHLASVGAQMCASSSRPTTGRTRSRTACRSRSTPPSYTEVRRHRSKRPPALAHSVYAACPPAGITANIMNNGFCVMSQFFLNGVVKKLMLGPP